VSVSVRVGESGWVGGRERERERALVTDGFSKMPSCAAALP